MSSTTVAILTDLSKQLTNIVGCCLFIGGIIGGILSIIIFLSLKTFQESPCAFYLTVMSFFNIGNLLTGLLSRILMSGFGIDWTLVSGFYCKLRWYFLQLCILSSFTCVCLAAIDQFCATNARVHWRKFSNNRVAHRLTASFIIIWLFHGIFYFIYFDLNVSPTTQKVTCSSKNSIFGIYHIYGYLFTLAGIVPLVTTFIFGILAHNNVNQLAYRSVPIVQRELDKQLTKMVLIQFLHNCIVTLPYTTLVPTIALLGNTKDPILRVSLDFANVLAILMYYSTISSPFYIYLCASERFRQQLIYVLFRIHFRRFRRQAFPDNQVTSSV